MIFPIGDDNSDRSSFPIVNVVLIAINILVFVFLQGMGSNTDFTFSLSTVPAEIIKGTDLVTADETFQVNTPEGLRDVVQPGLRKTPISVYLTLLTSMFMHGGIAHLLGKMWFLWVIGDNIEHDVGRVRYLLFYVMCGLLASLTHVLLNTGGPSSMMPSLGASGAISGVMGAYLVLHPMRRVTVLLFRIVTQVPGFVAVGMWFVFQVISSLGVLGGLETGVAYGAHIGGFIAGVALAKPFMFRRPVPQNDAWRERGRGDWPLSGWRLRQANYEDIPSPPSRPARRIRPNLITSQLNSVSVRSRLRRRTYAKTNFSECNVLGGIFLILRLP